MLKDNRAYDLLLEIAKKNGELITKDFKKVVQIFNYKNKHFLKDKKHILYHY